MEGKGWISYVLDRDGKHRLEGRKEGWMDTVCLE
ncbi:hypothetical protein M7I_5714 [Glarea lozoyensis 74030]|uniref:Uncharacterized protein n=1 Tax=Glarea lozoyensis (strain ATCC 74030 / MF5533) TaxID=1104152 RepID=H0ESL7_GLAL7|nr:hypothetical protein M7I_5714 [Glarea lozoyensis 74030]